ALRRPPTSFPDDPNEAPTGGFNFGAISVVGRGTFEGDQRFDEVNGTVGGALIYTNSRQLGIWPYLPAAITAGFSAVLPLSSELREDAGVEEEEHSRFDASAI